MCGGSADKREDLLVAVYYVSREPEQSDESENLRVICEERNPGSDGSLDLSEPEWMGAVKAHESVHMRLGETLKAFPGQPVSAATLGLVANQSGWRSRLRELRYLGWDIDSYNKKMPGGRVSSFYRLNKSKPWPSDPTGAIREYERRRAERNKKAK
jgi:hypothetical protein